ncbi:MAG: hypothetical protein WCW17_01800 [Patescibacteria group bacterium]|jgi:hypothetical protein
MNKQSSQLIIGISLIVICLGVIGWFYYSSSKISTNIVSSVVPAKVEVLETNFSKLFENREIPTVSIQQQQQQKVDPSQLGRDNPFAPY